MFSNLNKPAFGATAPSTSFGFGAAPAANANPFGQNQLFGKPTTGGFGNPSTSTFGQPASNTLFPSTQAQPTNLFQNANTSFGAQPATQTGFGTTNLFAPQQPTAGGMFNTASAFGQQNKPAGFGFGTQPAQPTLFGQQPQQQPQQQAASSIFQPTANSLFGGGGTTTFGGQQQAGTVIKFNPVTGTDTMMKGGLTQSINTKHHSITCMKEYENKSFEELRFEDYAANRKGPQQQTAGFGATPFGAPASSAPSLFSQPDASKTAFGQQTTGFGQTNSTFGQTNTGFGINTQQQTGGGLFGKPTGLGTPISSTPNFGFGTNTQVANPFGSNQAKPFGSATPLFGTNTTTTQQSAFGTNMFGKPQDGTAQPFGNTGFRAAPSTSNFAFATPVTTQAQSLFNQPSKPVFSQQPLMPFAPSPFAANSFGKPATSGFGATQPSMFGNTLGNTLMGNIANKPGLFTTTGSTGLFGNTNTGFQQNQGLSMQPQQQQQSIFPTADQNSTNWAIFTSDPFGNAPHLAGLEPKLKTSPPSVSTTDPKELKSLLDATKKVDTSRSSKLKIVPIKSVKDNLFDGLSPKANGDATPTDYIKPNCRRLILKNRPSGESNLPGIMRTDILKLIQSSSENENNNKDDIKGDSNNSHNKIRTTPVILSFDNSVDKDQNYHTGGDNDNSLSVPVTINADENSVTEALGDPQPHDINWTRTEYYTLPAKEELVKYYDENGSCLIKGFTIGRKGYGNVYFPDTIDIKGLNIEEIVHFRYREINVYPDESKKPPVGQGLNRKAQVTLDNVYPRRPGTNTLIKETNELLQMNFAEKLRKVTENKNAKFVDYRPETGSWVFKVEHFSRYGFDDSDDEEQLSQANGIQEGAMKKITPSEKPGIGLQGQKSDEALTESAVLKELADKEDQIAKLAFALDDEIEVEGSDHFQGDDDLLQQSIYGGQWSDSQACYAYDMSEEDYRAIPTDVPMHLGYDLFETNKNIQVMKSTLFDDGLSDGGSSHVSIIRQYLDITDDIRRLPVVSEERARRRMGILRPKVEKVYKFAASGASVGLIQNRSYLDMGIFKGKSFKAGWTKGFNFVSLNCKQGEIDRQIALNTIKCGSFKNIDPLREILNDSLDIVLEESSFTLDDSQIPTFKILKSNSYLEKQTGVFLNCLSKNNNNESRYIYSIWTLADALWGSHEETFSNRRHLLSEWLKVNTSFNDTLPSDSKNAVFDHLTVFKIKEAAELALENRCPNLSLIVSQLSVTNRTKTFLQEQIESWYKSMTADHIGYNMKKMYLLLSGIPVKDEINVFGHIDWKRAFGMHLWYISPAGAPVDVAIELYRKAFEEQGYAEPPNPPYTTGYVENGSFDVLYHILLLYKTRIHRLSNVLNPATLTDDHLDYRLSWLLLQLFSSLDVGIIEDAEKNKLCTSFSNQLESLGQWEYAIFVLLYLEDNTLKKRLILSILDRNLSPDIDKATLYSESCLVNKMHVPPEWIHIVKGNKTLLSRRYFEAFNHFAHSGDHGKANDILVLNLLPGLFINEQYDVIKVLIKAIKDGTRDMSRWSYEAGLYSDFLELQERFISFKEEDVLRIQMTLQSINDRIGRFPTKTDQQKVCVAEMSKRCASVYREVCEKCQSSLLKKSYSDFIERLVMPPDFKQIEALNLVNRPECFKC